MDIHADSYKLFASCSKCGKFVFLTIVNLKSTGDTLLITSRIGSHECKPIKHNWLKIFAKEKKNDATLS